ncbi:MAG TPA: PDZ domain-containing protein [Desulfomonilia bacterium]
MTSSIRFRKFFLAAIFIMTCASLTRASEIPPYITDWGFSGKLEDGGLILSQVAPQSSAAFAGLQPGDMIIAVNGRTVKDNSDFNRMPYVPVRFLIKRQGAEIERVVIPGGILKLEVTDIKEDFIIPGVVPDIMPAGISSIEKLDYINVLDKVVIDKSSGRIAVIGHYDDAYDTGRIPYLDLLKTAMAYPEPIMNLAPTPKTKEEINNAGDKVKSNLSIMVNAVRGHPGFVRERQTMIQKLSKAYGLTKEEYVAWYNYVKLDRFKDLLPPASIRAIQIKVFTNLGFTETAQALDLVYKDTSESLAKALEVLGKSNEARTIEAKDASSKDKLHSDLAASAYIAILESSGIVTPDVIKNLTGMYASGEMKSEGAIRNVQNLLMPYEPKNHQSNFMNEAFNGITFSTQAAEYLEGLNRPYAETKPIDLDGSSQLAMIMYEADYALKSINVRPDMFSSIPGSCTRTEYEIRHDLFNKRRNIYYRQWLEPDTVDMKVSPDNSIVEFGSSKMLYKFGDDSQFWGMPPDTEVEADYAAWCAQLMNNYDAYARIMPSFHKIREASKIIALARWARENNIRIDLGGITQDRWFTPEKVPAYWFLGQAFYMNPEGKLTSKMPRAFEGGVSYKVRGGWTQITPSVTTTTEITSQLILSSQLGRLAVTQAQSGDLEEARYLAELSAQALAGTLSKENFDKMNIPLPKAVLVPATAENIQLQKEILKETDRQIGSLKQNPSNAQAKADLESIGSLYGSSAKNPAAASDYLLKLQTGQAPAPAPSTTQSPGRGGRRPTATAQAQVQTRPVVTSPCTDTDIYDVNMDPERLAFLNRQLIEARDRLKFINTALRNLIKINESQRSQIEQTTREISKAYDESVDRAWSVVFDLMTSLPADKFMDNYNVAKAKIDDAIKVRTGMLTTPLDAADLQKVQGEIRSLETARVKLDDIYQNSSKLLDVFKGTNYGYEIDKWNSQEKSEYEKAQDGAVMIGKILLDHPALEKYLSTKAFFAGEKYWQVMAMGKMASYATGFFFDILNQQFAWAPLTASLNENIERNAHAMDVLRFKAEKTYKEISCLEAALQ